MSEQTNSELGTLLSDWLASIENFYDPLLMTELKGYAAKSPSPSQVSLIYQLLAGWQGTGMQVPQLLKTGPLLTFPVDHGEHYDTAEEWRYYTCSLNLSDGSTLSVITNLRRSAIASPGTAALADPTFRQIYDSSIAWTWRPVDGGTPVHHVIPNQTWWGGDDAIDISTDPFRFVVGPYSIISDGPGEDIFPLTLHLEDDGDGTRPSLLFDLRCEATNPHFPQGTDGFVGEPPLDNGQADSATYYYSWPQQRTTGRVTIGGATLGVISGVTWLDHQWGSGRPPTQPRPPGWHGWMWFEFQFDDNRSLTCSAFHDTVIGHRLPGQHFGAGTYVDHRGAHAVEVWVEVFDYVASPVTDAQYPCDWQIMVKNFGWDPGHWDGRNWMRGAPPTINLVIKPRTVLRDQILWQAAMSTEFSEAACTVYGGGFVGFEPVVLNNGVGYCEGDEFETPANHTARCLRMLRGEPSSS